MRVTNMMTTNQLLLNLNKSMNSLSFLQYQAETGNKIRYASDNPIIAGRSLKFRTNIVETEQYLSNVDQGRSWLDSTANAVKNVIEALSSSADNSIRSLLVGAANGTYTTTDSKIFANQLRETLNEIMGELNVTYAGRYIFSGYKTDEKPIFDTEQLNMNMNITQKFNIKDINNDYRIYVKANSASMPEELSVKRLKLAYDVNISDVTIPGFTITQKNSNDTSAYLPGTNEVYFLEDTGELIFGKSISEAFESDAAGALSAFNNVATQADLDAAVAGVDNLIAGLTPLLANPANPADPVQAIINSLNAAKTAAASVSDPTDPADPDLLAAQSAMQQASGAISAMEMPQTFDVNYNKNGFKSGEINPKVYFSCAEILAPGTPPTLGKKYNMDNQAMMYEFSINNKMQVNALAKDILTPSMMNDILDVVKLVENIKLSDYDELIGSGLTPEQAQQQIDNETKFYTDMITKKFTQLIGKVDDHSIKISVENTSIGSKLQRLTLISNRLQDDRLNFEDLKSANDYVDASEVYVRYTSMLSVYQSALQTGAKIVQMSLVNYI